MLPGSKKRKADFTDVVMYVAIASKHLRTIILLITMSLAAGLLFYIFSRPVYYSKSVIRYTAIGTPVPTKDMELKGEDFRRFSDDKFLKEFDADHIVRRTDKRLSGWNDANKPKKESLKQVRATWTTDHNIELNVWAYVPDLVLTFPEAMVEEFLKERDESAMRQYTAMTNKYLPQIAELWQRWEKQLAEEQRLNKDFNPEKLKYEIESLDLVPRQLEAYKRNKERWEYVRHKVENPVYTDSERLQFYNSIDYTSDVVTYVEFDRDAKERLPMNARPSNGTVIIPRATRTDADESIVIERSMLQLDATIKEMSATYRPGHPKMVTLYKQYEALQKKLKDAVSSAKARFEIYGRGLGQKIRELEEQLPTVQARKRQYDEYLKSLNLNKQQAYPYESMIVTLKKDMESAQLALITTRVDLQFLKFDNLRDEIPISPNRLKIVLMSLGIGLALAIGVPFLLEFMDQTVTNVEKMEEATNIRGLGIVPDFEDTVAEAYPLIFSDGVANPDFIENFRVVRTNLLSSAATSKFPQVIMITSTSPKEGKTVVASNLAMSFAHMGEKTLILDANLRRGIEHHLFGSRSAPGLSNVLVEKYDVEDACRPTTMENLHILPCGDQLEGDIEQLGSPYFVQVIDKLRKRYQRIIVDAPPVLGLAETSVMQPAMDGVVLVIWTGQTPTRAVRTAMEILEANHANFYGFVLNRLDLMATMNRFHYYYYTNHYYNRYQSVTRAQDAHQPQSR